MFKTNGEGVLMVNDIFIKKAMKIMNELDELSTQIDEDFYKLELKNGELLESGIHGLKGKLR